MSASPEPPSAVAAVGEETPLIARDGPNAEDEETENPDRPTGLPFALVFGCVILGDFVSGYDTSCVTTLAPVITDDFNAIGDVAWYGIAYILASASTILFFGQLYTLYPTKAIYLWSYLIFTVGSVISAAAPSSVMFIIGRAVSGLGSAGIFSGGNIITANITPLKTRPIYQSIGGGVESVAIAFGPLISGAIAHSTSWRMSFYFMVPMTTCTFAAVFFFVKRLPQPENANLSSKERFALLDLLGVSLFVPATVCLIIPLQWGGTEYAWSDIRMIIMLGLAGVLGVAFVFSQWHKGEQAMFPLRFLKERSVTLGAITMFGFSAAFFVFDFYLPIYFQAVRDASTLGSGLMFLPTAASFAAGVFSAGFITSWIGYYTPMMLLGTVLLAVGAGLITTLGVHTPAANWIFYQILLGSGAGLAWQQPFTAVQTVLQEKNVATALVALSFIQELGGIVSLSISQNVFLTLLVSRLTKAVPELDPRKILDLGTLSLRDAVPPKYLAAVYEVYNATIVNVFYVGLACACLTIAAVGIEWRSVKEEGKNESEAIDGHADSGL